MENHRGYVALLDVLGFPSLLQTQDSARGLEAYLSTVNKVVEQHLGIDYVVFSDSVVIFTHAVHRSELDEIVLTCSHLFYEMLRLEVPIRGAIAAGLIISQASERGHFLAGAPIIEAYTYEKQQDWVGIMLAPSVRRIEPKLGEELTIPEQFTELHAALVSRLPILASAHQAPGVPLRASVPGAYDCLAIVPRDGSRDRLRPCSAEIDAVRGDIASSVGALRRMKAYAPDSAAQHKYDVTIDWLQSVGGRWAIAWEGVRNFEAQQNEPQSIEPEQP